MSSRVGAAGIAWARWTLLILVVSGFLLLIFQLWTKWHTVHGLVHYLLGNHAAAITSLEKALHRDPRNAYAHMYLGETYLKKEEYARAIEHFREVTRLVEDHHKAYFLMGLAYSRQRLYGPAIAAMTRASQLRPAQPEYLFNLGLAYKDAGRYKEALPVIQEAMRYADTDALRYSLGHVYYLLGELDAALKELDRAIVMNPGHPYAHAERARVYLAQGRLEEAIRAFETDIRLSPNNFFSWYDLGRLYMKAGQAARAREVLEKAATIDPQYPYTYQVLSDAYRSLGLAAEAEAARRTFEARKGSGPPAAPGVPQPVRDQ